ncbi:MAG: cytochrome c3 family protein [bacterium]|jgi:hypothetical protein
MDSGGPIFPAWFDRLVRIFGLVFVGGAVYILVLWIFLVSPKTTRVGYQPEQPVPYSHALHAGKLGMDCRYCHTTVEETAQAAIPPTQTCMNCHTTIWKDSPKLLSVRESYATGMPIKWVRVHNLPDFVYFNHSAHVTRGIGCVSCHGRVDKMETVYQKNILTMGWCLDCHRNPEKHLRPKEFVTSMDWVPEENQKDLGKRLAREYNIKPSTDCWTCHR